MAMHTFIKVRLAQQSYNKREQVRKCNEAMYQMELQTWQPYRLFGLFSSIWAMAFTTVSITNNYWYIGKETNLGIWNLCSINVTISKTTGACVKPYWQNAVIGLLIFAVTVGFLATVLSISGVCATQLPKKIYYYHSAGEIYLICSLSCLAALVVYPSAIALELSESWSRQASYGVGYGLGWGAAFFFLLSAVCMCLDDLVRAFARGTCCECCERGNEPDNRI